MHTTRRTLSIAVLAGAAALLPAQQSPLTGVERTAHFDVRFRPGSRAEASVDRVAALVEGDLARILGALGLEDFPHRIELFLYDDVGELQRITGVQASGYSVPLQSHVPHDNDQTRVHELVHVIAEKFTETGDEPRNLFFAEGLANAVLVFVSGVHVDAVAAFHRRRGDLPGMAEMHAVEDFYAWLGKHPHVNSYDVAGSWMRFLLDRHGAAAVRRYYRGVPPAEAFGVGLDALERAWHEHLDAVELRPGVLALLQQRHGRTAAERNPGEQTLDADVLGPESEWKRLGPDALAKDAAAAFDRAGRELRLDGEPNEGDWCTARLGDDVRDGMVRCTFTPGRGCFGVKLQFGEDCQALVLRGQGAFVYTRRGGVAHDGALGLGDGPVQLVLRRRAGRATVWIDGKLALDVDIGDETAPVGVGCVGGPARARNVAVRRF